jgi:hypothetical protein
MKRAIILLITLLALTGSVVPESPKRCQHETVSAKTIGDSLYLTMRDCETGEIFGPLVLSNAGGQTILIPPDPFFQMRIPSEAFK